MSVTSVADPLEDVTQRRLPYIDYGAHPAYGGMFPPDHKLARATVATLQPWIDEAKRSERERAALFGYRRFGPSEVSRELATQGCSVRQLAPELMGPLHQSVQPLIGAIRERLGEMRSAGQSIGFKATQEMIGPDRHREIWKLAASTLQRAGVVQASLDYFGAASAKLKAAAVMVNPEGQDWCADLFPDAAVETPPTVGFHIDSSSYCTLKVVLYLDDVESDQGPFGLIPTSHLWEQGGRERTRRRAFDRSPLVSRAPGQRRAFASLPADMQLKAEFGGDMRAGAPDTEALLRSERVMTGPRGQLNLFDPEAIHRGGHVRRGERQVMLLSVAARWPAPERGAPS